MWLQYPVWPDGSEDPEEAELWDFDELKHQIQSRIVPVLQEALHQRHSAANTTYCALHAQVADLATYPDCLTPAIGPALPPWLPPGPYGLHALSFTVLTLDSPLDWGSLRLGLQVRWRQLFTRQRAHQLLPCSCQAP
jgi:hypothetical protein